MVIALGVREKRIVLTALAIAFNLQMIGCSSSLPEQTIRQPTTKGTVARGTILIDILESGHPEYYWQYELQPSTGLVRNIKEEKFQDYAHEDIPTVFQQPTGAIEACAKKPEATSLDGKYLARCTGSEVGLFVTDKKTGRAMYRWTSTELRQIRGFAWAPDSHSIAVLNVSSYYGKGPIELLSGLSGHPVPHDTVFLDVLDMETGKVTEYTVRNDVPYSFTRILNWSE